MKNQASPDKLLGWFDPRHRQLGSWAFILNRITAIGLTVYLFLHLIMLGQLAQGEAAYNNFITLATGPIFKFGEMFVIAGALIHGLNGLRVAMTSFGVGVRIHKPLFLGLMALAAVALVFFGIRMFAGH